MADPRFMLLLSLSNLGLKSFSDFDCSFFFFLFVSRVAVVTGSNKGIGFEICRQLANNGITVVLTARDENKGLAAVQKLKTENGFSDQAISFHPLDVSNPDTIASRAAFVKTRFGKLDILASFSFLFLLSSI